MVEPGFGSYLQAIPFFIAGYAFAYMFKSLSNLQQRHGIVLFILIMVFFISAIAVILPKIEYQQNYLITGAYLIGFLLRFFRDDH